MKQSGVVRRIDNLGRIVIPKEIRKHLRIQSGDNLEFILSDNESLLLKKYSYINKLNDISQEITNSILLFTNHNVLIADNDKFVAGSGSFKKKYLNKKISNYLLNILNERKFVYLENCKIELTIEEILEGNFIISPIISSGDSIGIILLVSNEEITKEAEKIIKIFSEFLSKYIE